MEKKIVHLLMIEDSFGDARLIYEMLRDSSTIDFKIEQAFRLSTGIEMLKNKDYDIVLLDLALPDSFGLDTLKSIIAEAKGIPIVVMTSNDDEALGIKAVHLGAQDYIMKLQYDSYSFVKALSFAIERKKNEETLAYQTKLLNNINETVSQLQIIFDNISIMLVYLDKELNFVNVNRAFAEAAQHDPEFYAGKNLFDLFPEIENEAAFEEVIQSGESRNICTKLLICNSSTERVLSYWDLTINPARSPEGEIKGLILSVTDVASKIKDQTLVSD